MSTDQYLRNNQGHAFAIIRTQSNGVQTIHNIQGHKLGEYRPQSNTTHNIYGHQIGYGNLLVTLLHSQN